MSWLSRRWKHPPIVARTHPMAQDKLDHLECGSASRLDTARQMHGQARCLCCASRSWTLIKSEEWDYGWNMSAKTFALLPKKNHLMSMGPFVVICHHAVWSTASGWLKCLWHIYHMFHDSTVLCSITQIISDVLGLLSWAAQQLLHQPAVWSPIARLSLQDFDVNKQGILPLLRSNVLAGWSAAPPNTQGYSCFTRRWHGGISNGRYISPAGWPAPDHANSTRLQQSIALVRLHCCYVAMLTNIDVLTNSRLQMHSPKTISVWCQLFLLDHEYRSWSWAPYMAPATRISKI